MVGLGVALDLFSSYTLIDIECKGPPWLALPWLWYRVKRQSRDTCWCASVRVDLTFDLATSS
jgi:hypothetical protein